MGQRHQVFLIARVRPHGVPPDHPGIRRCIAALHHQWCYGSLPLTSMRRLVTLIGQPDNAAIVRAELRDIQGKYGSYGAAEPRIPDVPCPFTATLLAMAWTANLEDGSEIYASGTTLENGLLLASMGCWEGDNNDGLSILDVTNPERPAYCFLSGPERPGTPEQHDAPLDARGYLSIYYELNPPDDNKKDAEKERETYKYRMKAIEDLADVPVLPVSALREAWPTETFKRSPQLDASPLHLAPEPTDGSDGAVSKLADMSLGVSVKQSVDDGDTAEVEKLMWLPGKAARVKAVLRELEPFANGAVKLLAIVLKELKETSHVDLAGFRISGAQVAAVLSALGDIRSVDLSDNAILVADDVPDILAATPTLRRIVLMGCPSVDGARLLELVLIQPERFKTVEGILHPSFFSIKKSDPYPCAFTYVSLLSRHTLSCVSLPFFTPAQVVQALTDIIPWQAGTKTGTMFDIFGQHGLPCVGTSAFQGGTRDPGQRVSERTIMTVPFQSPRIPRGQKELWTFVCNLPPFIYRCQGNTGWGFVHYVCDPEMPAAASESAAAGSEDERLNMIKLEEGEFEALLKLLHEAGAHELAKRVEDAVETSPEADLRLGNGTVYDLKGFLECMAKEGRPMPSDEAVEKLEKILYLRDEETGEYCCPLMKQEDVSAIDPDDGEQDPLRYEGPFSIRLR